MDQISSASDQNTLQNQLSTSEKGFLTKLLRIEGIHKLYQDHQGGDPLEFIDSIIQELGIKVEIKEDDLARIPKEGPFITVSNHPMGALDGLVLIQAIAKRRPDYKLLVNAMMDQVDPLKTFFINLEAGAISRPKKRKRKKDHFLHVAGLKHALLHLEEGKPLGIFPAGEVSVLNASGKVEDKLWDPGMIKFIRKAEVPVIPIYIHGSNSTLFHLLGLLRPSLQNARLPREITKKKERVISFRLGRPISPKDQLEFEGNGQFGRFLRSKTYALGSSLKVKRFFMNNLVVKAPQKVEEIPAETPKELIKAELERIGEDCFLFERAGYRIYLAGSSQIPVIMNEIGRLREITFRAVGEGTNKAIDLDEFDLYYRHLFIYDTNREQIAGAYRIGFGDEIVRRYGRRGFYINTLFRVSRKFQPILAESIELGRSFVTPDYQRRPHPLLLLWKGILFQLMNNPGIRYVIGPVSISNQYSKLSQKLIAGFFYRHYYDRFLGQFIKPRKIFAPRFRPDDDAIIDPAEGDINKLDKIIEDIEPEHARLPVLIKKYMKQNARILGFNRDPKFNNALDALMIMDIRDLPEDTFEKLSRDLDLKTSDKK